MKPTGGLACVVFEPGPPEQLRFQADECSKERERERDTQHQKDIEKDTVRQRKNGLLFSLFPPSILIFVYVNLFDNMLSKCKTVEWKSKSICKLFFDNVYIIIGLQCPYILKGGRDKKVWEPLS